VSYLTNDPIALNAYLKDMQDPACGASVIFLGITRNHNNGKEVIRLEYEAHHSMANKVIAEIIAQASRKWNLKRALCVHRLGLVMPGEASIIIITAAAHRKEAYEANQFIINKIKKDAPVWKREFFGDGTVLWGKSEALPEK
jgi:molybdopterin synthase catalytic subunit